MRVGVILLTSIVMLGIAVLGLKAQPVDVPKAVGPKPAEESDGLYAWLGGPMGFLRTSPEAYEEDLKVLSRRFDHDGWQGFLKVLQHVPMSETGDLVTFRIETGDFRVLRSEGQARKVILVSAVFTVVDKDPWADRKRFIPTKKSVDVLITVGRDPYNEIKILGFALATPAAPE